MVMKTGKKIPSSASIVAKRATLRPNVQIHQARLAVFAESARRMDI